MQRKDFFVEEQSVTQQAGLLSSWKEIAAYLGVSVRTAQKWEAERGLPVRRLPGGRGRVIVSIDELSAWLQAPPVSERLPLATPAFVRGIVWRWVGVPAAVLLVMLVVGAASFVSRHRVPTEWRVTGDTLIVVDDRGRELWTKPFGFALTDYRAFSDRDQNMGWIGDVDGDGEPEVVFLAYPKSQGTPMVYCYSRTGEERWRFIPGQRAAGFAQEYRPPYNPVNLVVFHIGGALRLAVASVHHTWFPSQIALLSGDGKLLREYWHAGHLPFLGVSETAGNRHPLLYAGGIANAYHRAALVVLDPASFGGVSHEENAKYQLPGDPAREVARVLFPRTCINRAKETYNAVMSLRATPTELNVGVTEEIDHPAVIVHTFTLDGRYRGAGLSSQFVARHTELENTKLLNHHLDAEQETANSAKLEWLTGAPSLPATRSIAVNR
ncbi:helix-turn-helix domain-containing protein [Paludibaculum fermentans]|uniref:helix-turn-helix domain-containing protein n=1 Tax=Paludibaculum fermentans TaxID=1473598 RepID=UPI003EBECD01